MRRWQVTRALPSGEETISEIDAHAYVLENMLSSFLGPDGTLLGSFHNTLTVATCDDEPNREVCRIEMALACETEARKAAEEARDALTRTVREQREQIADLVQERNRNARRIERLEAQCNAKP